MTGIVFQLSVVAAHLAASLSCTRRTQHRVAVRRMLAFTTAVWVFPCLYQSLVGLGSFCFVFLINIFAGLFSVLFCPVTSVEQ